MNVQAQPKVRLGLFVLAGIAVAVLLALFVSPHASSSPDGLEKVAADHRIDRGARESSGPMKDYTVGGSSSSLSTGVAGVIGIGVTFAVGSGLFLALKAIRPRDSANEVHMPEQA